MTISITVKAALDGSTWQTPRADMVWTNITPHVSHAAGVSIKRGRSTTRDDVQAGECSLTLLDTNRTFDPENTAGAYYGFLNPGVPIWIYCDVGGDDLVWGGEPLVWDAEDLDWGAASFSRFFGFIEDWPQGSYNPADRVVSIPIQAYDAFSMLALGRLESPYETVVLAENPRGFWPLDEQSGFTMRDLSANRRDGIYTAGATQLSTEFVTTYGVRHRGIGATGEHEATAVARVTTTTAGFCAIVDISGIFGDVTNGDMLVLAETGAGDESSLHRSFQWGVEIVSTSARTARLFIRSTTALSGYGYSATFDASYPRHLASTGDTGASCGHYVDGTIATGTTSPSVLTSTFAGVRLLGPKADGSNFQGIVSGLVWTSGVILDQPTANLWQIAALRPGNGDTTDERIADLLDQAGFPTADRSLSAGYSTLGASNHGGNFTLDEIRRVEKSEQGRFFISVDGDATFHARYHTQFVATASEATFSDDGADSPYSQVEINRPRGFIYNKVTVNADGQSPATVSDATSIAAYGERELTIDAPLVESAASQRSLAGYVLANSKDPQTRVYGLSVPLHRDFATLGPDVLALEQGARVTFERTPVGTGSTITLDQVVEGYSEQFDTRTWTWTPHLSPAEPATFCTWGGSGDEDEWGTGIWGF